ncbi:MAG: hypothetical protein IK089_06470, partial [Oxalobacter sp.]|nr:hypothetical protein [Oxalobacter sp.]
EGGKHMLEFKNGIIYSNSRAVGNIKDGIIRQGTWTTAGHGTIIGNVKDGVIWQGNWSTPGHGTIIGNVRDETVRKGTWSTAGHGTVIGKTRDYKIKGMDDIKSELMVACYHFFEKPIF